MSTHHEVVIGAGGAMPPATVKVWDPFVRVFHWSLATLFIVAYATGGEAQLVHIAVGYGIVGLVALRVIWGFVGPHHARFSSFVRSPRQVIGYLRSVATLRATRHLGHNPAGGAMIIALMIMLTATGMTGYMMTTDAFWGSKWVEEVHEAFAKLTVGLVVLHVFGVLFSSLVYRENLVKAMVTGQKRRSSWRRSSET
ncbi:MAG: cytochrome b/b6 domain-containing protein [Sphingobacteriales bacterium]